MIRRLLEGRESDCVRESEEKKKRDAREKDRTVVRVSKIRTEQLGGTINHAEKSAAFRGFINQLLGM